MTRKSGRPKQQYALLKTALLTGSLIATLAGTQLLGRQEPLETAAAAPSQQSVLVIMPPDEKTGMLLPPDGRQLQQIQRQPIPQLIQPSIRPIARSRSSR